MYLVIRRYKVEPDDVDDVIDLAKNKFLPELIQIPGFKAFYHIHAGEDTLVSVSVFADKIGADLSNKLAHESVKEIAADLLPLPPEIIEGDVVTSEVLESLITPKPTMV